MAKLSVNPHRPGSLQGRLLRHANLQSRRGRPGLPVPADLLRRTRAVPPRLRHGALQQPLHEAGARLRHGLRIRGGGPARGAAPLSGGGQDRLCRTCPKNSSRTWRRSPGTVTGTALRSIASRRSSASRASTANRDCRRSSQRSRSPGATWKIRCSTAWTLPGHGQDLPGEADRHPAHGAGRGGDAHLQDSLLRAEPGDGSADGGPLGQAHHPGGPDWLVVEKVTPTPTRRRAVG